MQTSSTQNARREELKQLRKKLLERIVRLERQRRRDRKADKRTSC